MLEGRKRVRKAALVSLTVLGVLAAVLALSVGGLMIALQTNWGGERLRRQAVKRVNQAIQGTLGIARLSFGGDRIVVWDVILRDPEGAVVAQVARAEVDFRVTRLLHKQVDLTAVSIEAPHLALVSGPRGLNLSRAIAARRKGPETAPKPKSSDEGWVLRLDRLGLSQGDVTFALATAERLRETVHFAELRSDMSLRYATGNGSTDLTFTLKGRSALAPVGPLALNAEARLRGAVARFSVDGVLLGGTVAARGNVNGEHLEAADASVAISIPPMPLGGFEWGPLQVSGQAHPNAVPALDMLVAIPGLEVTVKGGGTETFKLDGRVALADLALTAKAVQALTTGTLPSMAGHGELDIVVEGPLAGAPASWSARSKGSFDRVRVATASIADLTIDGRMAHLSRTPGDAALHVAIASVTAGTTKLNKIELGASVQQQDLSIEAKVASPEPLSLAATAHLDDDQKGLALTQLALSTPSARWASEGVARLRFEDQSLSLHTLRLLCQGQELSADAAKSGERISAHVALTQLRLDLLPSLLAPPEMRLGGTLDVDVRAAGDLSNPQMTARARLEGGRLRGISKLSAQVDAALADHQVDGTLSVDGPIADLDGAFRLPMGPLAAGAEVSLRLDVARLDLAGALRAAAMAAQADGRLSAHLRVTGSAESPNVDLAMTGRDLVVTPPSKSSRGPKAVKTVDVGHGAVHLTYAERAARADIDLASAHGGTLRVEAIARVDLSYPRVSEGFNVKKMPVHGKVVAKDFEVGWLSQFNERMETLGGQVSMKAQLAGTVGDPQFVGDVRWKNGTVVTVAAPRAAAAR